MDETTGFGFTNRMDNFSYTSTLNLPLERRLLVWQDYLVFAISLSLPLLIGLFCLISRWRKRGSVDDFLTGERSINYFAVALSLLGSIVNGIFVIGTPAEVRYYGGKIAYTVFGLWIAAIIVSIIFVPKYQGMSFTSAYEYLERRYNYPTRVLSSLTFIVSVVIYLSVVLYVPALAFAQMTGINQFIIVAVTGVVCTIYTAMGGIRAVVYTDALQMIILLIGLIAVSVIGAQNVGGGQKVWEIAVRTGRINFDGKRGAFDLDPRARNTFWSQFIGVGWTYIGLLSCNQMMIQRYISVDDPTKSQASLIITWVALIPVIAFGLLIGLIINATYEADDVRCDPLLSKQISSQTQIVPYFIMQLLGNYHGIPGLLIASIFSAALSSIASVINALSAVFLEDIIGPIVLVTRKKPLTESGRKIVALIVVIVFGLLTIALSYAADRFTNILVQATGTIWGVLDGPLAGLFIAGFFMPFCNSFGAIVGLLGGLTISLWIAIGGMIYAPPPQTLPLSNCHGNITVSLPISLPTNSSNWFPLVELYKVTWGWYGVIGIFSSLIINVIASLSSIIIMELFVKRGWTLEGIRNIPTSLLYSCADEVYCYCPESCKKPFRCGVDYEKIEITNGEAVPVPAPTEDGIDNKSFTDDSIENEKKEIDSGSTRF